MTGLKPHVLRYWETEFDALSPKKNRAGNRAYTEHDLEVVRRIQGLLRDEKYTIEGARQAFERRPSGANVTPASVDELRDLRAFLSDVLRRL